MYVLQWKTSEANQLTAILQVNTTINLEIKLTYNCAIGQELVLFNNKEILIRSQTIFFFTKNGFRKESSLYRIFYSRMANFLHSRVPPKVRGWMQFSKLHAGCFRDS